MNLGLFIIYRNDRVFAKLHWLLFKLFKIKRTIPCGRRKKDHYLCCMLHPTEKTSYLVYDEHGYEVRCKCCDSIKMMGNTHPETLQQAIRWYRNEKDV